MYYLQCYNINEIAQMYEIAQKYEIIQKYFQVQKITVYSNCSTLVLDLSLHPAMALLLQDY